MKIHLIDRKHVRKVILLSGGQELCIKDQHIFLQQATIHKTTFSI